MPEDADKFVAAVAADESLPLEGDLQRAAEGGAVGQGGEFVGEGDGAGHVGAAFQGEHAEAVQEPRHKGDAEDHEKKQASAFADACCEQRCFSVQEILTGAPIFCAS